MRAYLRSLDPGVSRGVWWLLLGSFANAFGNGVVFPFALIYLHNVRGIELGTAGLALATTGVAALAANPLSGALVDRRGAKATLVFSMLVSVVGFGGFALVREPWHAFVLAALMGLGNGSFWTSHSALIAGLTERETRHNAYAMQRVLNNLGIGLGGVAGGLIATTSDPRSYELLFALDACTFLVYLALLGLVPSPARAERPLDAPRRGYRHVLAHRTFLGVVLLNASVMGVGFVLLQDIFPAFAKNEAGVTERGIGLVFLANTLVIVVAQLPVARWLEGRRRMAAYAVESVLWAVSWAIVLAGGLWFAGAAAAGIFALALGIFALGECFHGTVKNALIADLAQPGLLGRYLAVDGIGMVLGGVVGRAAGGFALSLAPHGLWVAAAAAALAGGAYALTLERFLPERLRRTPRRVAPAPAVT